MTARVAALPRPERSPVESRLLRAAEDLFSKRGFHRTQVADITAAAGIAVGTFYRYFSDKEDILKRMLEDLFTGLRGRFVEARAGIEHKSPMEQFSMVRETFRLIFEALVRRPALTVTLFRTGYGVNTGIDNLIWKFIEDFAGDMVADMERVERAGLFEIPLKEILAHSLVGMALHVAHALVVEKPATLEEAVDSCTRFTLGGLLSFAPDESFDALMPVFRMLLRPARRPGKPRTIRREGEKGKHGA